MSKLWKRIVTIGKAKANKAVDALEDPVEITEQAIRDMKDNLEEVIGTHSEVKAVRIGIEGEASGYVEKSIEWNKKALKLKERYDGEPDETQKSLIKNMIVEALNKKENYEDKAKNTKEKAAKIKIKEEALANKIRSMRDDIKGTEESVDELKADDKVADAELKINKQLSGLGNSSTKETIDRMKEKVNKKQAKADAYAEIADEGKTLSDNIDEFLKTPSKTDNNKLFDDFMKGGN